MKIASGLCVLHYLTTESILCGFLLCLWSISGSPHQQTILYRVTNFITLIKHCMPKVYVYGILTQTTAFQSQASCILECFDLRMTKTPQKTLLLSKKIDFIFSAPAGDFSVCENSNLVGFSINVIMIFLCL